VEFGVSFLFTNTTAAASLLTKYYYEVLRDVASLYDASLWTPAAKQAFFVLVAGSYREEVAHTGEGLTRIRSN
jgi:hypothetical protein